MSDTGKTIALIKALAAGSGGSGVTDVKINGSSVVTDGVANVPLASSNEYGAIKVNVSNGLTLEDGTLKISQASATVIRLGASSSFISTPAEQHRTVFFGLAKAAGDTTQSQQNNDVGTYTETAKSKISDMLNAPETVSGSTPSITAKAGVRYICGECSTLSITAPESGIIDVVFESGSTPTVLTVTSAKTGVSAIKWAGGWDGTCESDTTYEINILDGEFGVVGAWT